MGGINMMAINMGGDKTGGDKNSWAVCIRGTGRPRISYVGKE